MYMSVLCLLWRCFKRVPFGCAWYLPDTERIINHLFLSIIVVAIITITITIIQFEFALTRARGKKPGVHWIPCCTRCDVYIKDLIGTQCTIIIMIPILPYLDVLPSCTKVDPQADLHLLNCWYHKIKYCRTIPVMSTQHENFRIVHPYLITWDQCLATRIDIKSDSLTRFAWPG